MTTVQFRRFAVGDPSARVIASPDGRWLLLFDPEGTRLYRFDTMFLRELGLPKIDGVTGAFRYDRFNQTSEVGIVCDNEVRRFALKVRAERAPLKMSQPTAICYNADGSLVMVGTAKGYIHVFNISDEPQLVYSQCISNSPIELMQASTFANALTVVTESRELWSVALTSVGVIANRMDLQQKCALSKMAFSRYLPMAAMADRSGLLFIVNLQNGFHQTLEFDGEIVDLNFVSTNELAIAFQKEILVVLLDRLAPLDDDLYMGRLMLPPTERIFAISFVEEEVVVIYE